MAKTICKILGVVFLLVGVAGFAAPHLLGAHLTPAHNVVHILSGVVALYFGFAGSLSGAKAFCRSVRTSQAPSKGVNRKFITSPMTGQAGSLLRKETPSSLSYTAGANNTSPPTSRGCSIA